jgi:hypothetical protein
MHHGEFTVHNWIHMTLGPPLLGSGIGLLLGLARGRPGRAALAGAVGGAAGAWGGVLLYCLAILPRIHDTLIFSACVLGGFLVGAISLGFYLAGPPDPTRTFTPVSGPVGGILGGILGFLLGIAIVYLSMVPGTAAGVEYIAYLIHPVLGAAIGVVFGLVAVSFRGQRSSGV